LFQYHFFQAHVDAMWPWRTFAQSALFALNGSAHDPAANPLAMRQMAAAYEVFGRTGLTHRRPEFGIDAVKVGGREVAVIEEAALTTPFGTLLHFRKGADIEQPRVLIVAPMSGHFATLLRDTVRVMLPEHDVYITDWHNARDVSLVHGRFDLEDYIEHLIRFVETIGPGTHVLAVCQPCVPALAAVAVMAEDNHISQPRSLTLMAGPIDCRINPTAVNRLATTRTIDWFESHMICFVPLRFRGAMRRVYPGFLQLSAFMSMNLDRHVNAFSQLFNDLVNGDAARAAATSAFYEEYFAVADLPAEFYLQTVQLVFQEYALARGELFYRGRRVNPAAIRRTFLLTIEGERDDICAVGQTLAAQDLCTGVRPYMRQHHVQTGAGHYGVFSGKRWANEIYPLVRDVIYVSSPGERAAVQGVEGAVGI
jgi:polyhydroxyalkanoate depolymerase